MARSHPHDRLRPRSGALPHALAATLIGLGGAVFGAMPAYCQETEPIGYAGVTEQQAQAFLLQLPRMTSDVPVPYKPHPLWDPLGIHAGVFMIYPSITQGVAVNDNILATPVAPITDAVFTTNPQILVKSDWNQNSLNFGAQATLERYADRSDQDTDAWSANAGGTLNIYHDLSVQGTLAAGRHVIPRTSDSYAEYSLSPLYVDQSSVQIVVNKQFNRLQLAVQGSYVDDSFSNGVKPDGGVLEQGFRNEWGYQFYFRANYEVSNYIRPFFESFILKDALASKFEDQFQTQNLVGADLEITHLMVAEAAIGYLTVAYGGPTHPSPAGNLTGRVKLIYFPTELITLTASVQQWVLNSGYTNVAGSEATVPSFEADYEVLRNLIITSKIGASFNHYIGTDNSTRSLKFDAGATFKISRDVWATAGFTHTERISGVTNFAVVPYKQDILSISIILQR